MNPPWVDSNPRWIPPPQENESNALVRLATKTDCGGIKMHYIATMKPVHCILEPRPFFRGTQSQVNSLNAGVTADKTSYGSPLHHAPSKSYSLGQRTPNYDLGKKTAL